jgi:hypothetical protein
MLDLCLHFDAHPSSPTIEPEPIQRASRIAEPAQKTALAAPTRAPISTLNLDRHGRQT